MSEKREQTNARDGWIAFALSLLLWGTLLGGTLLVGHRLALSMIH